MKKYSENIEMVDPQLKNNADLAEILADYESLWEKGMNYLVVPKKCQQLIYFSHIIETTSEKYKVLPFLLESKSNSRNKLNTEMRRSSSSFPASWS